MPGHSVALYGLKNCDTCRKARRDLEAAGHTVRFIDVREDADLEKKLPVWLKAAPLKLVNKSSATWRSLSNGQKAKAGTQGEAALLAAHPTLIKRPVIEIGGAIHVGWDKTVQALVLT